MEIELLYIIITLMKNLLPKSNKKKNKMDKTDF